MSKRIVRYLCAAATTVSLSASFAAPASAAAGDTEMLLKQIELLQRQIDELKAQVSAANRAAEQADEKAEAAVQVVEQAPKSASWTERTRIGGYGELHYNKLRAEDDANDLDEIDFHRFVIFLNHEFNDRIRFFSELELEHSLVEDTDDGSGVGEVELEQAYVEADLSERHRARAGLFLLPVGILNETHEPTSFYGVERNDVESIIIPSTWWEAGLGLGGRSDAGLSWDIAAHSGLKMPTEGSSAFRVRSGRQKVAEADASEPAITGRIKYTGVPGLEVAASIHHQFDPSQTPGDGLDDGTLVEAHLALQRGRFGLRALYARWDFSGSAIEAAGADEQYGWYVEPSYRVVEQLGIYARYEDVKGARAQDQFNQWEVGLNWWPHPNVVFKADYRDRSHDIATEVGRDFTGFDLGIGYQF